MVKSTISIAMCTYNGARFLQEQLDSFSAQTHLPDEVVVCDDGSTDETMEILERWASNVPFEARIVRNEKNLGFAKNFEKAVSLCTKDVVFLSDQDDIWLPEKLARMTEILENSSETAAVFCEAQLVDSRNEALPWKRSDMLLEYMNCFLPYFLTLPEYKIPLLSGCCSVFRREILEKIPTIPEDWGHDAWFFFFAQLCGKMIFIPDSLVRCRVHESNTSHATITEESFSASRKRCSEFYQEAPGAFYFLEPKLRQFLSELEKFQPSKSRERLEKRLLSSFRHFANRERVQRSTLKFLPLWFWEIIVGGYSAWPESWKSVWFDFQKGLSAAKRK